MILNLLYYLTFFIFLATPLFSADFAVAQSNVPTLEEFLKISTCSKSELPPASTGEAVTVNKYENSTFGFKILYPSDWQLEEQFCTAELQKFSQDSGTVSIHSTPSSKDIGSVMIGIGFDPLTPLDDYVMGMTNISIMDPSLKVSYPKPVDFKGIPGYYLVISKDGTNIYELVIDANGYRYTISTFLVNNVTRQVIGSFNVL